MASIGFRIFCVIISSLFFFESAFSVAFIGDTQSFELHKNTYGQLNKIEDINEKEINFAYNGFGARVSKIDSTGTTRLSFPQSLKC